MELINDIEEQMKLMEEIQSRGNLMINNHENSKDNAKDRECIEYLIRSLE